jgi:hypothetical protein
VPFPLGTGFYLKIMTLRSKPKRKQVSMEVNLFIRVTPELTRDLLLQTVSTPCNQFIPQILPTPGHKWIDPMTVTSIAWVFSTKDDRCASNGRASRDVESLPFGAQQPGWGCPHLGLLSFLFHARQLSFVRRRMLSGASLARNSGPPSQNCPAPRKVFREARFLF